MNKRFKYLLKSLFIPTLILMVLIFTQISIHAATLFNDNFEDGNSTGWSTSGGSWSVVSDGSWVYKQSSTSATAHAYSGTSTWTNYSVQTRMKILSFNGTDRPVGLCARFQSSSNYYYFTMSNANQLALRKKVSGAITILASKAYTVQIGTWYTLKLVVNGTSLQAYVNGVLELSATDSSLTTGRVGFTSLNVSAEFDDIIVEDSSAGTPTPTPTQRPATPTPTMQPGTPTPTQRPATPTPTLRPGTPTPTVIVSGALYVAPNGSDSNPGTLTSPTTLQSALTRIAPGGVIYMRGGTYSFSTTINIARANSGSSGQLKQILAYGSEKPVLDFSAQAFATENRGVVLDGHYWKLKGLTIQKAGDNGMLLSGSNNTIEQCAFVQNRDSGLQVSRYDSNAAYSDWPANNLILNCDSTGNYDTDNGEDADGFACKLTSGPGNIFRGCIAYRNSDDGWDLFTKSATGPIGTVLIENCIAYENGYLPDGSTTSAGDGNGFKLGGESIPVNHTIRRSIAFGNKAKGFHYNNNPGSITVTNNTGWNNPGGNFRFDLGSHIFTNNLSYLTTTSDIVSGSDVASTNCWWNKTTGTVNGKGLSVTAADFLSLTPAISRNTDGSINLGNFLKLAPGSDLINAGTPSGTDIGAVESQ